MSDDEVSTQCSGLGAQSSNNNSANINQYEFLLGEHMDSFNVETSAVHRKLQSKVEALRILRQELEKFRVERDQYKLMAETLQLRYSALKHNSELLGNGDSCSVLNENSSVAALLHETRNQNLKLNTEVEALKQKLYEVQGDIELLREKEVSHKSQAKALATKNAAYSDEECQWKHERANFISHMENLKKKNAQLAFDFKAIIDEKEELITERDAYKCKAHRLNHELFVALKANESHPKFLDIDGVLLENKYLHERIKNQDNELQLTKQSATKYKAMLEAKRKKGIVKLGGSTNGETILNPSQVKTILNSGIDVPAKLETASDFKSLCIALLDNVNDKGLALSHQKKTNKILAQKIAELEQRLHDLIAGDTEEIAVEIGYSPSQLLLNGYCASMVDDVCNNIPLSTRASSEESHKLAPQKDDRSKCSAIAPSDDGMSSLSTESAHSILSSEYGIDVGLTNVDTHAMHAYKSSSATTDSGNCGYGAHYFGTPCISSAVARERMEDLKDLPPHLAALVQKALYDLDVRDHEAMVAIRAENARQ